MSFRCLIEGLVVLAAALWPTVVEARDFKVCGEPDNLPFSNSRGEGFENQIGRLVADDLHAHFVLVPIAQRGPAFLRKTLGAGRCDALMSMPPGVEQALVTEPYYTAGWVFLTRKDGPAHLQDFNDPRLGHLTIGVPVVGKGPDTPPVIALANRGMAERLHIYAVNGADPEPETAAARMVEDVANRKLDLAIIWAPAAGYYAARQKVPLILTPAPDSDSGIAMRTSIGVAVDKGNADLRDRINEILRRRRGEIETILAQYDIPVLR
jgi:mxaJ protein